GRRLPASPPGRPAPGTGNGAAGRSGHGPRSGRHGPGLQVRARHGAAGRGPGPGRAAGGGTDPFARPLQATSQPDVRDLSGGRPRARGSVPVPRNHVVRPGRGHGRLPREARPQVHGPLSPPPSVTVDGRKGGRGHMKAAPVRYRGIVADSARWEGFQFRDDDIVISTPPKCGTTWMQTMCALVIFQTPDFDSSIDELSPWLDMLTRDRDETVAQLERQTHRRFIKSHTPLDGLPFDERVTYICVGRDP